MNWTSLYIDFKTARNKLLKDLDEKLLHNTI